MKTMQVSSKETDIEAKASKQIPAPVEPFARRCRELSFPCRSLLNGYVIWCSLFSRVPMFRLSFLPLYPKITLTTIPLNTFTSCASSPLIFFATSVVYPSPRLPLKSIPASPYSPLDRSFALTPELLKSFTLEDPTSADRASSQTNFVWLDLVSDALNSAAVNPKSVLPSPSSLVTKRRCAWRLNLMLPQGFRIGPNPSPFCPPPNPLPKLSKPMKPSAGLSPYPLRPRSVFKSVLQSPNFLMLLSFRESNGRFPVMVMMDLAWISSSLSQNLVDSLSRLVRFLQCLSLVLNRLELFSLWKCPRVLLPTPSIVNLLSSSLPLALCTSVWAGNGRLAIKIVVCLGGNGSYHCRDKMLSFLWTLSETPLPTHRQMAFRVKRIGIMTLSLRSRSYRSLENSLLIHSPFIALIHVMLIYCLDNLQSLDMLEKYGIMTMSSRSGYRLFLNLVNPSASSTKHFFKSSDALFARASLTTRWSRISRSPPLWSNPPRPQQIFQSLENS
ncbi:unnamed protein product [Arabidopsis thaliana]|uniref:Uncharacterized protein n=1 Tax=Arabidopsis thaliana TaxID=3702 RepID=A0A654EWQ9_ARATH|nr:unnamed protein product [Arabidopsis thaliana]